MLIAASDEAQAASTVRLTPPKSRRLAMRPAATFGSTPANDSSVHSGKRSQTSSLMFSTKRGSSARRPYCTPSSPAPTLAPRIPDEIGRASCRERGCQYVEVSVYDAKLKKKITDKTT